MDYFLYKLNKKIKMLYNFSINVVFKLKIEQKYLQLIEQRQIVSDLVEIKKEHNKE